MIGIVVVSAPICVADHLCFSSLSRLASMAAAGGGRKGRGDDIPGPNVTDLLSKLNLTEEEGAVADFSDDEDDMDLPAVE